MKNVNAETFINHWWAGSSSGASHDVEDWMEKSCFESSVFWKDAVFALQEKLLPSSQSIFGKSYDFYHDCMIRHVKSNHIAFITVKEKDQTDSWSYEKVHHCVNFHVDKWSSHSPQKGQLIALVTLPGIHLLISLLTSLRFGLKICYLPTNSPFLGRGMINKFLSEIKPDLIVAKEKEFAIEGIPLLEIDENKFDEENYAPHSYAYPASEDVQLAISLQQPEALSFRSLDAHTLYLRSLQDSLLTLNLIQHPYWAAPLACPILTEPCSTLMSLLCGTTRVHVDEEAIKKDPLILQDERIHLLGLSSALQQLWRQKAGVPSRQLRCCYKYPLDINYQSWKSFVQLNRLEKIPILHLLMDNSLGGISVFSKPTTEIFNFLLKPALGIPWSLTHINGTDEKSLTGYGIFNSHISLSESNQNKSNLTITQQGNNLMITGSLEPCREGVTFPIIELEDIINNLPFVEVCMVHPIRKAGTVFSSHFVLLVFINPMKQLISDEDKMQWSSEITQQICDHLGCGFLPDQIEYFSLLPKMHIWGIDRAWCTNQYNSGLLLRKKDFPQYQTLSILKMLVRKISNKEKPLAEND